MPLFRALTLPSRRALAAPVFSLITLVACLLSAEPAAAQNRFSIDGEAAFPTNEAHDTGWGVGARFGHEWDLVLIAITPEIGFNYHAFGGPPEAETFAVLAGGRVGIDFVLAPSAFLHAGVGHFGYDTTPGEVSQTSIAYEMGLALDFTLLPVIDLGVHAAYAGVGGDPDNDIDTFDWLAVGGHVSFVFGGDDGD
jgi:hypothetical protein